MAGAAPSQVNQTRLPTIGSYAFILMAFEAGSLSGLSTCGASEKNQAGQWVRDMVCSWLACSYTGLGKTLGWLTQFKGDQGWRGTRSGTPQGKKYGLTWRRGQNLLEKLYGPKGPLGTNSPAWSSR